jgi:hypothetical protein
MDYAVKTLCGQCATKVSAAERRQLMALLMVAILIPVVVLALIFASSGTH